MLPTVMFFLFIVIWPADNTGSTQIAVKQEASAAVCEADEAVVKHQLGAQPAIRFVDAQCFEADRGEKS